MIAIYLAVNNAVPQETTLICTDSLSSIQAIKYFPTKHTSRRIKKCFSWLLAQIFEVLQQVQTAKGKILFYKVPSHVGIFPNLQADALAEIATNPDNPQKLRPTEDIPLTAVAATLQYDGSRLHRPAYKFIRERVGKWIKGQLTHETYNRRWIPPFYKEGIHLPVSREHTPISKSIYDRKSTLHSLSKFVEEATTERLKLPITSHTEIDELVDRCPLCRRNVRCDTVHYFFRCAKTRIQRQMVHQLISTVANDLIQSAYSRLLYQLTDQGAYSADIESVNMLLLGPPGNLKLFDNKEAVRTLKKLQPKICRISHLAWRTHSSKLNRIYENLKEQTELNQQNAQQRGIETEDESSDDE